MIRRPLLLLAALLGDALREKLRLRFPRVWPWALVLLTGCCLPPPRFGIGRCSAAQVELQRAEMTAQVIPAVLACVQAGNAEDCPVADAATERWLAEREACR